VFAVILIYLENVTAQSLSEWRNGGKYLVFHACFEFAI